MAQVNTLTPDRAARVIARCSHTFDAVEDVRLDRGKRYAMAGMLNAIVGALASGKTAFRGAEAFAADVDLTVRRALQINGSPSDTAYRELVARLGPDGFREQLWSQVREDLDHKAVTNDLLAGGAISMDGKGKASGMGRAPNATCRQSVCDKDGTVCWNLFALEAVLISSSARPILDMQFIDGKSGEATNFPRLLGRTVNGPFPQLFRYVFTDSGMASASNAQFTLDLKKVYVFAIKENFNRLFPLAQGLLASTPAVAETTDRSKGLTVHRQLRRVPVPNDVDFPGATQFWGLHETCTNDQGQVVHEEHRVYITAVPWDELSPEVILKFVRLHWGIENNCNWTLDEIFLEDTRTPCGAGQGPQVMSWLRALAYNLVAVFRAHLPEKDRAPEMWRRVLDLVYQAMLGVPTARSTKHSFDVN